MPCRCRGPPGTALWSVVSHQVSVKRPQAATRALDGLLRQLAVGYPSRVMTPTTSTAVDFPVTRVLWVATLFEVVVLAVSGLSLLFLPDLIVPQWPWPLSPFTARALGAVYLAAAVSAACLGWRPWWSPARLVVPMVALFATIVAVLSVVELSRFTNAPSTAGWLVLYAIVAVISIAHLWLYRGRPPAPNATPPGQGLRAILGLQVVVLGAYGLLLLTVGIRGHGILAVAHR